MTHLPSNHREFLATPFVPYVELGGYTEEEQKLLLKYGAWLDALMLGKIEPLTDSQRKFVEMCGGKRHPETKFELVWKRYRIDRMYDIAKQCEYHVGSRFTYGEVEYLFKRLALQGHAESLKWSKNWKLPPDHKPPLISIKNIYPTKLHEGADIYNWRRMPGNPGSRR